ncbi:similar to Saccharomyces cerevisiae YPL111W CAR1 Arginase, responsible for arginine degradation, expression responds to both induction by arginine and nitrogen catabolite repression [Maudiozyma barnettii]|mgnify:CR=1 FL=1|uniref:Arginase n=1 Tax=Maudiozyma barnettii TaxID=61262 RepID=A0A8H2VI56_9SACH|nr:arginase [Kazachstania barnettii]CAB4255778.1 similar to Saccharomyces cerevisiae YPL111W CAR1 Arginase, responsible for arginine degradation, expression responds to both induction by arginine and nitrogen catabolite repression [Kazachstania barnettii]CAD1784339.1 similar to Saccharomyces cerevisiae YPL111W CAR1 Arginase, responsible for arginine degradation, expression responds to both induction by arginine and nitrogen catabolite repression [Kazachstania barnettii]
MTEKQTFKYFEDKKLSIVCAPFCGGQGKGGVEKGPRYFLKNGLENDLKDLGWNTKVESPIDEMEIMEKLKVHTGTDFYKNAKRPNLVGEVSKKIHDSVKEVLSQDRFPLTLGGDHSIAIGTVSAVIEKYPDAGLLWIDAHADINTLESTDSGNLHGCPVSFLMGLNKPEDTPTALKWCPGTLKPNKIAYIGLRDVDAAEKKIIKDLGIAAFSMYHVDKYGINNVIEMALKAIHPNGNGPVMCSYDVDAVDPLFVPATGTPVRGGLTLRESLFLVERLAETGDLVGLDIVECNPNLAVDDIHVTNTISAGCAIARCALGETLL